MKHFETVSDAASRKSLFSAAYGETEKNRIQRKGVEFTIYETTKSAKSGSRRYWLLADYSTGKRRLLNNKTLQDARKRADKIRGAMTKGRADRMVLTNGQWQDACIALEIIRSASTGDSLGSAVRSWAECVGMLGNRATLLDAVKFFLATDYGVYQIYGAHPVYGSGVLLYIGLAADQTFATRLSQENEWPNNPDAGRVEVYVGRLWDSKPPDDDATWCHRIALAERLLIYANQPAENAQKELKELEKELRRVHVINWRFYRDLLPEASGACWADRFADVRPNFRHFSTDDLKRPA